MNTQKRTTSPRLLAVSPWEIALIVALVIFTFAVVIRTPVKTFPAVAMRPHSQQDPYDLQPDRASSDSRARVETGL